MKKTRFLILAALSACILNSCVSLGSLDYPQPVFDKPFVYVIDSFKADGSFKDFIKLYNTSTDSNISFFIYIHHPENQEWLMYGAGVLKGPGDRDTIRSGMKNIGRYRYFAIEPANGKNYKYQFHKSRNDLHIAIMDN